MHTVTVDLYSNAAKTETTYIIPGPPLYGSGSGSAAPSPTVRIAAHLTILVWYTEADLIRSLISPRPPPHRRPRAHRQRRPRRLQGPSLTTVSVAGLATPAPPCVLRRTLARLSTVRSPAYFLSALC